MAADAELLALVHLHPAEQVGPEDDLDAGPRRPFQRLEAGIEDAGDLRLAHLWQSVPVAFSWASAS